MLFSKKTFVIFVVLFDEPGHDLPKAELTPA